MLKTVWTGSGKPSWTEVGKFCTYRQEDLNKTEVKRDVRDGLEDKFVFNIFVLRRAQGFENHLESP